MIALSPAVGYIHEPLNMNRPGGISSPIFKHQFPYISKQNENIYYDYVKNALGFPFNLVIPPFRTIIHPGHTRATLREYINFCKYRICNARPLLKDPTAVFSAQWLASSFNMDVIVLIRHPAAFISSIKRLNWGIPVSHLLEQPLLMKDHLYQFEVEIKELAENKHDIIDNAALIWRLIHHTIAEYQNNRSNWIFIRHEDLSRDPLSGFENIFSRLNLKYSEFIRDAISKHTNAANISDAPFSIVRSSESNIWVWKNRLTSSEIDRIRTKVENISRIFYSTEDW